MNTVIPSDLLNRDYCIASGNEYLGVPSVLSSKTTEQDFFNTYDGCAFE